MTPGKSTRSSTRPLRCDEDRDAVTVAGWAVLRTVTKAGLCRLIAAAPVQRWAQLSALVRRIWPGFRDA